MITEAQILSATDEAISELGSKGAQRILSGKSEEEQFHKGTKLLLLKEAYENAELDQAEKEALLSCLIKVSDKFVNDAITKSGGLGLSLSPPQPNIFYVGHGNDLSHYYGSPSDISGYI